MQERMPPHVLGTMERIGATEILEGVALVKHGRAVSLNHPLTVHLPKRPAPTLVALEHQTPRPMAGGRVGRVNDDRLSLSLQGSSHWDALGHFGVEDARGDGVYFGGAGLLDEGVSIPPTGLGMEGLPSAIVTRGVLLDLVTTMGCTELGYLPPEMSFGATEVERCLADQSLSLRPGDVVALYTGFEVRLRNEDDFPASCAGLRASSRSLWHDHGTAGLVCDTPGLEPIPADFELHAAFLREDGMALGELWALHDAVTTARELGQYEFLLASVPLSMPGMYGSPANAVAVF